MAKNLLNEDVLWSDRKHHLWFPLSFTKYQLTADRLYCQSGLFNTHYDELLLYRIVDICLQRNLGQKICGTGTIILTTKADSQGMLKLENIKNPIEVKRVLSDKVEISRKSSHVVGREFYGANRSGEHHDSDDLSDDIHSESFHEADQSADEEGPGFDFDHTN